MDALFISIVLAWAEQHFTNLIAYGIEIARAILHLHIPTDETIGTLQCVICLATSIAIYRQFICVISNR